MRKLLRPFLVILFGASIIFASNQSANAYGSGSWTVQPSNCNSGTFSGYSFYDWPNGLPTAQTSESGNFCWTGNVPVTVAIHDNWGNYYAWSTAANYVKTYFPANYDGGWGGVHAWGNGGGRLT
jgi:hypothetical protein